MFIEKNKPIRSRRIREAARGEPCAVRIPGVCSHDAETTVFAHFSYASSGMGTKPSDTSGAFSCDACHSVIDGRRPRPHGVLKEDLEWCKARGMAETIGRLVDLGIIAVKGAA